MAHPTPVGHACFRVLDSPRRCSLAPHLVSVGESWPGLSVGYAPAYLRPRVLLSMPRSQRERSTDRWYAHAFPRPGLFAVELSAFGPPITGRKRLVLD